MQIDIKVKNIELTDAIRSFVEEKINSLDAKVARFGDVVRAEVEVGRTTQHHNKGQIFRAEVHIRLPGKVVYVESTNKDLYVAINAAKKEASQQILAYKGVREAKFKRGARTIKRGARRLKGGAKEEGGRILEEGV